MFFSEKSHSPFPAIRSCVSSVAYAANAQHAPTCPWFLTGEIHPCSHEFHCAGSDVFDDERKRPVLREETSFCGAAPLVGGRKPVARGRSSADATSDSAQSNAAIIVAIARPFLICRYYTKFQPRKALFAAHKRNWRKQLLGDKRKRPVKPRVFCEEDAAFAGKKALE